MAATPHPLNNSLGGFGWLDKGSEDWPVQFRRKWFASWLCRNWQCIYESSLRELNATDAGAYNAAIDGMTRALPKIRKELAALSTAEQLQSVAAEARKLSLKTTREHIESELEFWVRHSPAASQVVKASPWSNTKALEKRSREEAGLDLCRKQYPSDPDMQLALRRVLAILSAGEIWYGPARSPLRVRRMQRALSGAVRRLCKPDGGPAKLADFVANLVGPGVWPYVPAGMEIDLNQHFNPDRCRQLVRGQRGLAEGKVGKEVRAFWHILRAVIFRDELRQPLLRLAYDAQLRAQQKRKGWDHLRMALARVFQRITQLSSSQHKVTDAMIHHWPEVREMLSHNQVASLASILNAKLDLVPLQKFDSAPEGKSSVEVQIRRGRKQLKHDYGLD